VDVSDIVRTVEGYIAKATGVSSTNEPDRRLTGQVSLYTEDARAAIRGVAAYVRKQGTEGGAKWAEWLESLVAIEEAEKKPEPVSQLTPEAAK
jgi:hypothetical protein